jgi:hypothetical protein
MTLRVSKLQLSILYYKHFDTPCHLHHSIVHDTECQNVYNSADFKIFALTRSVIMCFLTIMNNP